MTIFDIDQEILSCIDTETGEVIDLEKLETLQMERDRKIHNVACWYKELNAEANAIKEEKQKLAKRQQVCENKAESLKKYLAFVLDGEKFKDGAVSISYRTTKSVVFYDDFDYSTLPEEYQKVTIEPKKTELKQAIENGQVIEGVELEVKSSIQIK